jgi:uncharacterized Zn ribbon protein
MRNKLTFSPRLCFWCCEEYMPTSGTQIYCPDCREVANNEHETLIRVTQQTLFHAQYPNGKPHTPRTCILCGQEYQWASTTQKYCPECRKKQEKQWGVDACFARYGIVQKEYDELLRAQNGRCAVCGKNNAGATQSGKQKRMYVDHDHKTGTVRGLLCNNCNMALGFVHDDPELLLKLVAYLRREK